MLAGQKEKATQRTIVLYSPLVKLSLYSYTIVNLSPAGRPKKGGGLDLVPEHPTPKESYYKYNQIQSAANVSKPTTADADLAR